MNTTRQSRHSARLLTNILEVAVVALVDVVHDHVGAVHRADNGGVPLGRVGEPSVLKQNEWKQKRKKNERKEEREKKGEKEMTVDFGTVHLMVNPECEE
jgi:hypothetical protein